MKLNNRKKEGKSFEELSREEEQLKEAYSK
jgi:hypothetical protein